MAKSALRKLKSGDGLSIVELMLCMLILLFCLNLATDTFNVGIGQFKARTRESEARILCNTLSLAVQDQLTYVKEAKFAAAEPYNLETYVRSAENFSGVTCSLEVKTDGYLYVKYQLGTNSYEFPLADAADYADGDLMVDSFSVQKQGDAFQVAIAIKSRTLNAPGGMQTAKNEFAVTPIYPEALA